MYTQQSTDALCEPGAVTASSCSRPDCCQYSDSSQTRTADIQAFISMLTRRIPPATKFYLPDAEVFEETRNWQGCDDGGEERRATDPFESGIHFEIPVSLSKRFLFLNRIVQETRQKAWYNATTTTTNHFCLPKFLCKWTKPWPLSERHSLLCGMNTINYPARKT